MDSSNYILPDLDSTKELQNSKENNYGVEISIKDDEQDLEKTNPKLFSVINSLRDMKLGLSLNIITKIDLTSSGLDVEKAKILSRYLVNSPIEILDLMYNNISDEGTGALVEAFTNEKRLTGSKRSSNITTLGLGCNGITDTGALYLANLIRKCNSIKQLFLFQNNIGDEGISSICEALSSSNSITTINNGIHSTLTLIGLGANEIGERGAQSIASMLLKNSSLQFLLLRQNAITKEGLVSICNSLKENNTLLSLDVRFQRNIEKYEEDSLLSLFEQTISTFNYRLSDLKISTDDQYISPCIQRNRKLSTLPLLDSILKNDLVSLSSLLSRDPSSASKPVDNIYPIFLASYLGYIKIFHLLIKYGANSNVSSDLGVSCSQISHGEVKNLFLTQSSSKTDKEIHLVEKWDFNSSGDPFSTNYVLKKSNNDYNSNSSNSSNSNKDNNSNNSSSNNNNNSNNTSVNYSSSIPIEERESATAIVHQIDILVKKMEEKGINKERSKEYSNLLINNGIDSSVYEEVTSDVLEQIGIKLVGDRLKIIKALHELSSSSSSLTSSSNNLNHSGSNLLRESSNDIDYLSDIKLLGKIGGGNFGSVFKGLWHNFTYVALKKSNRDSIHQFKEEASILMQLKHPNIVQYLGLWKSELGDDFIVTEYMALGSLCDILKEHEASEMESFCLKEKINKSGFFTLLTLLKMCKDAAAGMTYLSKLNIVHRDLACRNLLVKKSDEEEYVVKISDFGLSRTHVEDYYVSNSSEFAWRSAAPEVLQYRKFSSASDVYSFATTVWEIFEFGKVPFGSQSGKDIIALVQNSDTPHPKPKCCPENLYSLLKKCWNPDRSKRPPFSDITQTIVEIIEEHTDYSNVFEEDEQKTNDIPSSTLTNSTNPTNPEPTYISAEVIHFKGSNSEKRTEYDFTEV